MAISKINVAQDDFVEQYDIEALRLINSSRDPYNVGGPTQPVYFANGIPFECEGGTGGGGGSNVTITPRLVAGTPIANYTIDGTRGTIYSPKVDFVYKRKTLWTGEIKNEGDNNIASPFSNAFSNYNFLLVHYAPSNNLTEERTLMLDASSLYAAINNDKAYFSCHYLSDVFIKCKFIDQSTFSVVESRSIPLENDGALKCTILQIEGLTFGVSGEDMEEGLTIKKTLWNATADTVGYEGTLSESIESFSYIYVHYCASDTPYDKKIIILDKDSIMEGIECQGGSQAYFDCSIVDSLYITGLFTHVNKFTIEAKQDLPDGTKCQIKKIEGICMGAVGSVGGGDIDAMIRGVDYVTAGNFIEESIGERATAEGYRTSPYGYASHTEGMGSRANGEGSHAEGHSPYAAENYSHAEGNSTCAYGISSHVEGEFVTASGNGAHAEGHGPITSGYSTFGYNYASGMGAHTEGFGTCAIGNGAHAEGKGLGRSEGEGGGGATYYTVAFDEGSHAEGKSTTAYGGGHSEGSGTYTNGGHAEGSGTYANIGHAEGLGTSAIGDSAHAEGYATYATESGTHAEGYYSEANSWGAHAEGLYNQATFAGAHAEGYYTCACGQYSHSEGERTLAAQRNSHTEGYRTYSNNKNCSAIGQLNKTMSNSNIIEGYLPSYEGEYDPNDGEWYRWTGPFEPTGIAFVIGNGFESYRKEKRELTSLGYRWVEVSGTEQPITRKNAFSVKFDGTVKAAGTISASTTADYAEYFEWADGNNNEEDRIGYFVTFDEEKNNQIRIANNNDDYILGVVSGNPFILGNDDCDVWNGIYLRDDYGRIKYNKIKSYIEEKDEEENIIYKEELDENGNNIYKEIPKINPEYDVTKEYITRKERKEWSPIGMLGVLSVNDDGTCIPGKYCKVKENGIATYQAQYNKNENCYRVIERVSNNVIKIIFK